MHVYSVHSKSIMLSERKRYINVMWFLKAGGKLICPSFKPHPGPVVVLENILYALLFATPSMIQNLRPSAVRTLALFILAPPNQRSQGIVWSCSSECNSLTYGVVKTQDIRRAMALYSSTSALKWNNNCDLNVFTLRPNFQRVYTHINVAL